ncbi:MAG: multicopper oxidase domain-containing protein, partial [Pseudomonadota bacterium]
FAPFDPWLVALDGHPVPPRRLGEDGLWLGAAQRADLVLDVDLDPGETAKVIDEAYGADRAFEVMTWTVGDAAPIRTDSLPPPQMLPPNPIRRPDLSTAAEHRLALEGGAMSGMTGAMMGGKMIGMRELAQAGKMWALNGAVPADIYKDPPLFQFDLGRTQIIALENKTRWAHPIHLHGHSFHVLKDGEDPLAGAEIRDTVLLLPQESARIAFVADNPGKWMLHCHVLEHQGAGMMGVVEVS